MSGEFALRIKITTTFMTKKVAQSKNKGVTGKCSRIPLLSRNACPPQEDKNDARRLTLLLMNSNGNRVLSKTHNAEKTKTSGRAPSLIAFPECVPTEGIKAASILRSELFIPNEQALPQGVISRNIG
jgi:hypothetical protein